MSAEYAALLSSLLSSWTISPNGKTEKAVELAHPLRVAAGEIIVDGYYVNAFSGKSVEVSGQCCDEGFALARFHLGNTTLVKYDTADYLNREVLHIENS